MTETTTTPPRPRLICGQRIAIEARRTQSRRRNAHTSTDAQDVPGSNKVGTERDVEHAERKHPQTALLRHTETSRHQRPSSPQTDHLRNHFGQRYKQRALNGPNRVSSASSRTTSSGRLTEVREAAVGVEAVASARLTGGKALRPSGYDVPTGHDSLHKRGLRASTFSWSETPRTLVRTHR
jgi:hypothetical protein